jgi:glycyl-tRNA synthetase
MSPASDDPDLAELAKRRGFFFPSNEPYGGTAGFYTFGPQGAALKRNVEDAWRDRFAVAEGHQEIDAPTVMPEAVFEASGHLDGFDDPLVTCPDCGVAHRADHLIEDATPVADAEDFGPERITDALAEHGVGCPACGAPLAEAAVESFNLMFGTNVGPGSSSPGYLRPETAQGIFVAFPRLAEYARGDLPFGTTQIGRAYRNEISPRRSLLRVREFTQAELELFLPPGDIDGTEGPPLDAVADIRLSLLPAPDQPDGTPVETTVGDAAGSVVADPGIAYYLGLARRWFERVGVDPGRLRFRQHRAGERAHYASDCWDAEALVGAGPDVDPAAPPEGATWTELAGFAHRGDYDLSKHAAHADEEFTVFREYDEPRTVERATVDPDMASLGPAFGGAAKAVAEALEEAARADPTAFREAEPDGEVSVTVEGEEYAVPVADANFAVEERTEHGEHVRPEVVEPSFGIDRLVYTILDHALRTDVVGGEDRTYLSLPASVAPTLVGVFPLLTRDGLDDRARDLAAELREAGVAVSYDETGSIGRRYRRGDEVGTPYGVTVDHETLDDDTVTLRDRDTTDQVRVPVEELPGTLAALRDGRASFEGLDHPPADDDG